jgi:hypothetical protein
MSIFGAFNSSWSTEPSWNARGVAFVFLKVSRRLRFFAFLLMSSLFLDTNFCREEEEEEEHPPLLLLRLLADNAEGDDNDVNNNIIASSFVRFFLW